MSLQLRLTLGIAALFALLALAAVAGLNALTDEMRRALGDTASFVGNTLVTVLRDEQRQRDAAPSADAGDDAGAITLRQEQTLHIVRQRRDPAAPASAPGDAPAAVDGGVAREGENGGALQQHTRMLINGRELSPEEIAAFTARRRHIDGEMAALLPEQLKFEVRREDDNTPPMLWVHGLGAAATRIPIPAQQADAAIAGFRQQLWWGLALLLLAGTAGAALLARRIVGPLQALAAASERIGHGALNQRVAPSGPPEVRRSIEAFNRMAADLAALQAEAAARRDDRELAELGEIGRGLAHSLRNPLHALGLSLDALATRGGDDDRSIALAQGGREQLARIDQALRGFLALSASSGAAEETVDLDELLDDVVLEASQRAQGRVHFERARAGLTLTAVAAELRIVLHALVINAVEASPEGGQIRIVVERDAEQPEGLQVTVEDEGSGVPPALRARLFQPHVSSKPAGAGMGLYLAERLVRLRYRGRLALHDRAPRGTRAALRLLPRERPGVGA
jgi:signal transduction histidine kinase